MILSAAAIAITMLVGFTLQYLKLRKHHGLSQKQFSIYFDQLGTPPGIADAVYEQLRKGWPARHFEPDPRDNLREIYALEDDDIDDEFRQVLERLHIQWPDPKAVSGFPGSVETVEDAVRWISWVSLIRPDRADIAD